MYKTTTHVADLGRGSYGEVTLRRTNDSTLYACKRIKPLDQPSFGYDTTIIREINILQTLQGCKHIIGLLGIEWHVDESVTIFMEYITTCLRSHLSSTPYPIETYKIKLMLQDVLRGLHHCHERQIMHRDVKPENIMLHPVNGLVLVDFGTFARTAPLCFCPS